MDHIGIDGHNKESQIGILAAEGEPLERRVRTTPRGLAEVVGERARARMLLVSPRFDGRVSANVAWAAVAEPPRRGRPQPSTPPHAPASVSTVPTASVPLECRRAGGPQRGDARERYLQGQLDAATDRGAVTRQAGPDY
jgi:hypothetical protein